MSNSKERQLSRRELLRLSAAGVLGGSFSGWFSTMAGDARAAETRGNHKSCILLWMEGGPSHQHTFDLKEGGDFRPINSSVPGIQISEYLPKTAQQMEHMALLRGMSHNEGNHSAASFLLHTGYRRLSPEPYPALGSIAAAELGQPDFELPNYVCIDAGMDGNNGAGIFRPKSAYLGPRHSPLMVADPAKGIASLRPNMAAADLDEHANLLDSAEKSFLDRYSSPAVEAHRTSYQQALRLFRSDKVVAFEIDKEKPAVRDTYGPSRFGQGCLLARRLVEAGVPFVEVALRGWDDHGGAAENVKRRSAYMDPAVAALVADLKSRGMLENTLVMWMGEFGRWKSPVPGSREWNHWPKSYSTVLMGGGLKTGRVIGRTDANGGTVEDRPISVVDFMATVCKALGIDYTKSYSNRDRPILIVDKGANPVKELF
jgi:hypothetical protein